MQILQGRIGLRVLSFAGLTLAALLSTACDDPAPNDSATAATSELEQARDSSVCYRHVLSTSRNLCFQAFDVGAEQGLSEDSITDDVKACGFINWPSTIQECLRGVISSYGGMPKK